MTAIVHNRDATVDILRGFAIAVMIGVHVYEYLFYNPYAISLFSFYYPHIAYLFLFITGAMVALSAFKKNRTFSHYLKRGVAILLMAVFLDVAVYQIQPFITFDILYVIGFSMPLAFLFLYLPRFIQLSLVLFIFLATPIFYGMFGYPTETSLLLIEKSGFQDIGLIGVLKNAFFTGWFPLFPWLGFVLLGAIFGDLRWRCKHFLCQSNRALLFLGMLLMAVGSVPLYFAFLKGSGFTLFPGILGYVGFVVFATGFSATLFSIVQHTWRTFVGYQPFAWLGKVALLTYIGHLALLEVISFYVWRELGALQTVVGYTLLVATFVLLAYAVYRMKIQIDWKRKHWALHFLFGD
ncbi:MAG: heparan-alpha-glucosaminide N-acetyltransferase domain-containing protein [Candidatus Paceibacterota bacterium]